MSNGSNARSRKGGGAPPTGSTTAGGSSSSSSSSKPEKSSVKQASGSSVPLRVLRWGVGLAALVSTSFYAGKLSREDWSAAINWAEEKWTEVVAGGAAGGAGGQQPDQGFASSQADSNARKKAGKRLIPFPTPPDTRPDKCKPRVSSYDLKDSTVSIVIPYLREKYIHIKGTVGSILAHTPPKLLKEIVFISDGNTDEEAHEHQIKKLTPLARVIRLPTRHGLIYAKERGAREATGDIVMFFEPHCIVGYNWLEPLVDLVNKNPNSLILPTLDYIPQDNFNRYSKASFGRYRFEWNFNLIYTNPPTGVDPETSRPFYAPATSGGIFAIRKERFLELGLFDVPMHQWGGDQIELSFKAWRCGGQILVVPCSRVGHLFRDVEYRPYPVDVPQVVENYAKLARVWLEEPYLAAFLKVKPESRSMALDADLTQSRSNMADLGCKSMDWYVKNVDLELGWESTRICIPGAKGHPSGCEYNSAAPGRSTIDRVMPEDEYREWAQNSEFFKDLAKKLGDEESD